MTGSPIRHRVGRQDKSREPEARETYHRWLSEFLENGPARRQPKRHKKGCIAAAKCVRPQSKSMGHPRSIMPVATGYLSTVEVRTQRIERYVTAASC